MPASPPQNKHGSVGKCAILVRIKAQRDLIIISGIGGSLVFKVKKKSVKLLA